MCKSLPAKHKARLFIIIHAKKSLTFNDEELCFAFFLLPILAHAQVDSIAIRQWDLPRGVDSVVYRFGAPARWKGKNWIKLGGIVAGTAAMTLLDEPVRNFWKHQNSNFMDGFERVGYHYGKPYAAVGITGGLYLTGILLKNEWAQETGLMLATGLTTSTVVQTLFKNALGRARPSVGEGNYQIEPFSTAPSFHSLPSGHTTVAFTMSLIMARQVRSVPVKILFYSLATTTAISRLYADAHWVSDLAFGGTIAWFCADAAMKRIQANRFRKIRGPKKVIVNLYPYPGGLSLRARL